AGRRAMLAHRQAKEIAVGTDGKLRILANLLAKHYPERVLIFTADNATVYRISQEFLIPAITHQTPVKERHEILTKFREGEYKTVVASHVLNEGVDVPAASVAIILSGTGSAREYIQRLGRVLRKGQDNHKQAILYEVVAQDTAEEGTSARRRRVTNAPPRRQDRQDKENRRGNLQVVYGTGEEKSYRAAEQLEIKYTVEKKKSKKEDDLE
ncbi:helicase, partial [Fischerella thermalis CCMEE 5319]